jgi:molybdenum cofactor synthesis domain-containing protein
MVPVPQAIRMVMEETARILLHNQKPQPMVELSSSVSSTNALLHAVLAENVVMPDPGYPDYNASIMDGYAIRVHEFSAQRAEQAAADACWTHSVCSKVHAGGDPLVVGNGGGADTSRTDTSPTTSLPPAIYVTTGARVPDSYDCVVPIEECAVSSDETLLRIAASAVVKDLEWIRPMGCDIPAGSVVLPEGHAIDPVAIGLLRQARANVVKVKRRLQVGVLSTGNELIAEEVDGAGTGKIPDVNRPVLLALLSTYNAICEPVDLGLVRDDSVDGMAKVMQQAVERCDVIITSGGVSMGETDIVQQVLTEKCGGTLHFGRMHMKPGKPTTFVTVPSTTSTNSTKKTLVFAMPGNPVSATVCTQLLVRPCLDLLFHGIEEKHMERQQSKDESQLLQEIVEGALVHPEILATLKHDIVLDNKRPEYHRVQLQVGENGTFSVFTTGVQRSSRLMSMRDAEGLLVLPHVHGNKTKALQGETFPVLLLDSPNKYGKQPVRIRDSVHLQKPVQPMRIAVIEVLPTGRKECSTIDQICPVIEQALTGSNSGAAKVVVKATFDDQPDKLYPLVLDVCRKGVDIIVVSCTLLNGSFQHGLAMSNALSKHLSKVANSLALQARQGAASQDPKAALFEVVVGYVPEKDGAMLVCVPEIGVHGALSNVRGLLKHGLNLAKGEVHNHHHLLGNKH